MIFYQLHFTCIVVVNLPPSKVHPPAVDAALTHNMMGPEFKKIFIIHWTKIWMVTT